jgi:hypothetical protein
MLPASSMVLPARMIGHSAYARKDWSRGSSVVGEHQVAAVRDEKSGRWAQGIEDFGSNQPLSRAIEPVPIVK